MKNYIKLTHENSKILVNLDQIIMVMKNDNGETYIRLTNGYGIIVSESIDKIQKKLKITGAMFQMD